MLETQGLSRNQVAHYLSIGEVTKTFPELSDEDVLAMARTDPIQYDISNGSGDSDVEEGSPTPSLNQAEVLLNDVRRSVDVHIDEGSRIACCNGEWTCMMLIC